MTTENQAPEGARAVAMQQALDALERCYDVTEWPANGSTSQDAAIAALRAALAAQPQAALEYRRVNPLGGPAKVFRAMADAIEAGDSYEDTLRRYRYAEAKPAPAEGDAVLVPLTTLEDASRAIGSFVSEEGWTDSDMQAMDNLHAYIARHKANAAASNAQPKGTPAAWVGRSALDWLSSPHHGPNAYVEAKLLKTGGAGDVAIYTAQAPAPAPVPMCSEQAVLHAVSMAQSEAHKQGDFAFWQAFGRAMWRQFNAMLPAVQAPAVTPDAARYQFLRSETPEAHALLVELVRRRELVESLFDAAVDAAMASRPPVQGSQP